MIELVLIWRQRRDRFASNLRWWFLALAGWTVIGAIVFVMLWPAMWVSPIRVFELMIAGTIDLAGDPHERQVFFAGEVTSNDPGWHFYPLVFFWRTSPVVLIGLVLALAAALLPRSLGHTFPSRAILGITLFASIYGVVLTIGDKKLDRYLLPSHAALDLVAAAGWITAATWIGRSFVPRIARLSYAQIAAAVLTVAVMGQAATATTGYPYYVDYYNPLFGGPKGARDAMMVGWGEGMDLVADRLSTMTGIDDATIATGPWPTSLGYFIPNTVLKATETTDDRRLRVWVTTDLRVVTYPEIQRQLIPDGLLAYFKQLEPVETVSLNGEAYAWVYDLRQAPLPNYFLESELPIIDWDSALRQVFVRVPSTPIVPGKRVRVSVYFQTIGSVIRPLLADVQLIDQQGESVVEFEYEIDVPNTSETLWAAADVVELPADLEPDTYDVVVTVRDGLTDQPLRSTMAETSEPTPSEIVVGTIEVGSTDDEDG